MTAIRSVLVGGSALLAAIALTGCSSDSRGTSESGSKAKANTGVKAASDVVTYHADYPSYDSLDSIVKESDVIVRGTVTSSRVQELFPEKSTSDDPAANPQAGLSEAEAAKAEPVVVTVSTVKVSEVLSGNVKPGATVEVSQLGGTLGGVTYAEQETTPLAKDKTEYVLMLADQGTTNPYDLLNPEQALYTVTADEKVTPVADDGFDNAGKVDQLAAKAAALGRTN
ncbi:hypothetical protein [Streptomyces sp. NBC_00258]|uniref:hypothetical protein n=1 Tax=Streptomyces sp. NBC_00258 TaxID=2903642 RepID=UPI002E29D76E|nr:hypothetical protein [Streptomyces sp. NBC_00258]